MVCAVSKYALLSIPPPQSRFERHNAVQLQPITESWIGPLHRRLSAPLHLFHAMIPRFTIDHLRALRVAGTWFLARRDSNQDGRELKSSFSPSSLPVELWMKCIWAQAGHITGSGR